MLTEGLARTLHTDFANGLTMELTTLLRKKLGLTPTIPDSEIGMLLVALVTGIGFQLGSGAEPDQLEGAYSAAWLAMLSLTQPDS
jgi:hypothetical protein